MCGVNDAFPKSQSKPYMYDFGIRLCESEASG